MITLREYLDDVPYRKEEIDLFLDENQPNWARYDRELGYLLKSSMKRDGMDNSYTIAHYESTGERRMINFADKPCRINTYGNSFTQCHQVSDGETWQEYLAANFGEPIRNFGIGGYGVYQAYLRMMRNEQNDNLSSEYVILNIFPDDHYRSIDKWRWIRIEPFRREIREVDANYFHANPWNYVRINSDTRQFEEHVGLAPTTEDLYRLCDKEYVYELLKDDLIVHLELAKVNGEFNKQILIDAAELLQLGYDFSTPQKIVETAIRIHTVYALRSTMYILNKTKEFTKKNGKKLMILLSYGTGEVVNACEGKSRFDQILVDYLEENDYLYVDSLVSHTEDYKNYNLSPVDYMKQFYVYGVGHYKPRGNHFFAFAIKDRIIEWLDEKPITYTGNDLSAAMAASHLA